MKYDELTSILERNSIPTTATLLSDSGWECGPTTMDGIYYNEESNTIVFKQKVSPYDTDYYDHTDWRSLV